MKLKRVFSIFLVIVSIAVILPLTAIKTEAATTLYWPVPGHFSLSRGYTTSHDAMDINDSKIAGSNIVAALGGTVYRVKTCTKQHYGNTSCDCGGTGTGLVIKGEDGRYYSYAHMQAGSIPTKLRTTGEKVAAGEVIGKVGTTGNSSGPHLHFSIAKTKDWWLNGLNPEKETYIYTNGTPFTISEYTSKVSVSDTDAVIAVSIKKPSKNKVITYAATVYENGIAIGSISDTSSGWSGTTNPNFSWTVSKMGIELNPGTEYQYTFTINVSGVTLTSAKYTFKTTGVDKRLAWPVPGHTTLSQKYSDTHDAIDISDSSINGSNIVASMGGSIYRITKCTSQHYGDSSCDCGGSGTGLVIKGEDGRYYSYAHMQAGSIPSSFAVGTKVSKGEVIGKVGTTGNSSGPHLHFSISLTSSWWNSEVDPQQETYKDANISTQPSTPSFTFSRYNKTIEGTNTDVDAVVGVSIKKASSAKVITYAATIYENGKAIGSISDKSSGWVGETDPKFWWSVSKMGVVLKPGTKYQYTFTINVDGVTLTSPKYDFQTTGTATYTVSYDANGGVGAPSAQTKKYDVDLTLSNTQPTRDGYIFMGWSINQNDDLVTYVPGAKITENKNLSLYAVWKEEVNPATITKQPTNITAANGEKVSTTVEATGDGLTYTWYYTSNKAGAEFFVSSVTGATYTTTMDATRDGRKVYCVITDKYNNVVTTDIVTLSMKSGLAITKQPTSVTVANGEKAATTVTATGEGLTYTWYYTSNGNTNQFFVSSVTSATYTTTMDATRDGRKVYCVITDKYGNSVTTNTVTLSMKSGLAITKQPTSVTAANGEKAATTVTATGEGLKYTWYYTSNGKVNEFYVSSVTGATYTTTMDNTRDGRKVYCVITDKYGNTVKTNTVTLSMKSGLAITKQPTSVTAANGEKAATTVVATGEGLTYTWYYTLNKNGVEFYVSSVTGATYTTTMDATRDGRKVYCVITDKYGNTVKTNTVTLSMKSGLAITKQPTSVTVANGSKASTTVTATGEGLTYTWYYTSNKAGVEFFVSSVTGATYTTTMDESRAGRKVYCVITDKYGNSVTTNTVTLSMK